MRMRQRIAICLQRVYRAVVADESGATTFEWTLLLAAIAIPSLAIITMALDILIAYFEMMTTMNGLPLP